MATVTTAQAQLGERLATPTINPIPDFTGDLNASWSAVKNVDEYHIKVSWGVRSSYRATKATTWTHAIPSDFLGQVCIRVIAVGGGRYPDAVPTSRCGNKVAEVAQQVPLAKPQLNPLPADFTVKISGASLRSSWSAVDAADRYKVKVSYGDDESMKSRAYFANGTSWEERLPDGFEGHVCIEVVATGDGYTDSDPASDCTLWFQGVTDGLPLPRPVLDDVPNFYTPGEDLLVDWGNVVGAKQYRVNLAYDNVKSDHFTKNSDWTTSVPADFGGVLCVTVGALGGDERPGSSKGKCLYEEQEQQQLDQAQIDNIPDFTGDFRATWNAVADATLYEVTVSWDNTAGFGRTALTSFTQPIPDGYIGQVCLSVVATSPQHTNSPAASRCGNRVAVEVAPAQLDTPTINPIGEFSGDLVASWSAVNNATSYSWRVITNTRQNTGTTTNTSLTQGIVSDYTGQVCLRVTAKAAGYTDSSPAQVCGQRVEAEAPPQLDTPTINPIGEFSGDLVASWSAVNNATTYLWVVTTNTDIGSGATSATSVTRSIAANYEGNVCLRVTARAAGYTDSPSTLVCGKRVAAEAEAPAQLATPTINPIGEFSGDLVASWSTVDNADRYRVRVKAGSRLYFNTSYTPSWTQTLPSDYVGSVCLWVIATGPGYESSAEAEECGQRVAAEAEDGRLATPEITPIGDFTDDLVADWSKDDNNPWYRVEVNWDNGASRRFTTRNTLYYAMPTGYIGEVCLTVTALGGNDHEDSLPAKDCGRRTSD